MGKLAGNYRFHDHRPGTGTSDTFVGIPVERGKIAIITYMAVMDFTTANKKLTLGIRDAGGADHYIDSYSGTATYTTNHSLTMKGQIILLPGEQPIGIVASAGTSDVIYFTAHGGLYSMEEGGAA